MDVVKGQTFSHDSVGEQLGEGGMGVVNRADDVGLGRAIAIKSVHPTAIESDALRVRFLREARLAVSINPPPQPDESSRHRR